MLYFVIPVQPYDSKNIRRVEHHLNCTISSLLRQTFRNWRAVLVLNGEYEFRQSDDRVECIRRRLPVLQAFSDREKRSEEDASTRRLEGVAHALRQGATQVMCLDADDLLSNRFVDFVQNHPLSPVRVENGWQFLYRYNRVFLLRKVFAAKCGSSLVLPAAVASSFVDIGDRYVFHHHTVQSKLNGTFIEIPFPAVVYVTEHGSNLTSSTHRIFELFRSRTGRRYLLSVIVRALTCGNFSKELEAEFGSPWCPQSFVRLVLP